MRKVVFFTENGYEQDVYFFETPDDMDDIELDEICLNLSDDVDDGESLDSSGYWEDYVPENHNRYADNNTPVWRSY